MSRPTWIASAAYATGYPVVEVGGWQGRGYSDGYDPRVLVEHHTAGPSAGGDMPSLGIITNGRSDLAGPLCNYGLGRSGTIYLVADGKSNNAGEGGWAGFDSNYDTIGIEAENDGSQPWPAAQLDAYDKLAAEVMRRLDEDAGMVCSHAEWAEPPGRKTDPHHFDMGARRAAVEELLEEDEVTPADMDAIAEKVVAKLNQEGVKLARTDYNAQTLYANTVGEADKEPKGASVGAQVRQILNIVQD